jgi:hypothetical protein
MIKRIIKKNITVDEILPLYIYENKLKLEEIHFYSDKKENQEKITNKNELNIVINQKI